MTNLETYSVWSQLQSMNFQRQSQEKQPQGTKRALSIVHTQNGIIETCPTLPVH